jgi:hypothetical protein
MTFATHVTIALPYDPTHVRSTAEQIEVAKKRTPQTRVMPWADCQSILVPRADLHGLFLDEIVSISFGDKMSPTSIEEAGPRLFACCVETGDAWGRNISKRQRVK